MAATLPVLNGNNLEVATGRSLKVSSLR
jgi:hypothetical protein